MSTNLAPEQTPVTNESLVTIESAICRPLNKFTKYWWILLKCIKKQLAITFDGHHVQRRGGRF